jgi:hypothetical protein
MVANLTKREFIDPHRLGCGLKFWEQIANHPGTGSALLILLAGTRQSRGGGDLDSEAEVIGRWAGDFVVLAGDYAEDDDIPNSPVPMSQVYGLCRGQDEEGEGEPFTDISDQVAAVIEKELGGRYEGDGWRRWTDRELVPEVLAAQRTGGEVPSEQK